MTGIYSVGGYGANNTPLASMAKSPASSSPVGVNQTASLWGDPHIVAADGGKYDFQHTGVFNLLSDQGINLNGLLTAKPNSKVTYDTEAGLQVGDGVAHFYGDGRVEIGSAEYGAVPADLQDGQTYSFGPNASIKRSGDSYTVVTPEYQVQVDTKKKDGDVQYLNVKTISGAQGVAADGVAPIGLLGETFASSGQAKRTQPDQDASAYQAPSLLPQLQDNCTSNTPTDTPATDNGQPVGDSSGDFFAMLLGFLAQTMQLLQQLLQLNGFTAA